MTQIEFSPWDVSAVLRVPVMRLLDRVLGLMMSIVAGPMLRLIFELSSEHARI